MSEKWAAAVFGCLFLSQAQAAINTLVPILSLFAGQEVEDKGTEVYARDPFISHDGFSLLAVGEYMIVQSV